MPLVLAFSTAIFIFFLHSVRVIWPRVLVGECHTVISKIVAEWRMLVGKRGAVLLIIIALMYEAYAVYLLYMVRITV